MTMLERLEVRKREYGQQVADEFSAHLKKNSPEMYRMFFGDLMIEEQIKNIIRISCEMGYKECYKDIANEI